MACQTDGFGIQFVHSFIQYLLNTCYVPGTMLDTRDSTITKTETVLALRVLKAGPGKQTLSKQLHNYLVRHIPHSWSQLIVHPAGFQ